MSIFLFYFYKLNCEVKFFSCHFVVSIKSDVSVILGNNLNWEWSAIWIL